MAKICLFDHVRKFTDEIVNCWEADGNSVVIDRYWDARKVEESDITFFEFVDNSLMRASDPNDSMYKEMGLVRPEGKRIVARCHDIDAWSGNCNNIHWDFVTDLVFVAKHIQDKVLSEIKLPKTTKVHLIKHSINPEKFTFKEKPLDKKIALIGNINEAKNLPLALQVIAANPSYSLHIVGGPLESWKKHYVQTFIKRNNLDIYHQEHVDDMNEFLNGIDFLLLTSMKEAWSYIVAEAALKGIRPIVHWFPHAEDIWPENWLWNKVSEVGPMLREPYNPQEYRQFIESNYNFEEYLEKYRKLCYN